MTDSPTLDQKHTRRVVQHVTGTIEWMGTCVCGAQWPCPKTAKTEAFNIIKPLRLEYDKGLELIATNSVPLITIYDADLNTEQARALRDWLNEVLP